MAELDKARRLVINQLLDHAVFTASVETKMRKGEVHAREVYQTPAGQQRINGWFNRLFGTMPHHFQDNWLWLLGPNRLDQDQIVVLLATLKAIINTPAAQGVEADRVIEVRPVITAVQSVAPELSERQISKIIRELFVDRFKLLTVDTPEVSGESNSTVEEYWDVAPDFVAVAQLLVQTMQASLHADVTQASEVQRVNAYLLKFRYLDAKNRQFWSILQANKAAIAELWAPLQRFYLEVGDDYALLLDGSRRQLKSRQYFVALAVARSLGQGVAAADLGQRIQSLARQLYPDATINTSFVKDELIANALAWCDKGFWLPTPVAQRFAITVEDEKNGE